MSWINEAVSFPFVLVLAAILMAVWLLFCCATVIFLFQHGNTGSLNSCHKCQLVQRREV